MKFLILNLILAVATSAFYTAPGEITAENFNVIEKKLRIASGFQPKKEDILDFCYLSIGFYQKSSSCGCMIVNERFVATSARCVVE